MARTYETASRIVTLESGDVGVDGIEGPGCVDGGRDAGCGGDVDGCAADDARVPCVVAASNVNGCFRDRRQSCLSRRAHFDGCETWDCVSRGRDRDDATASGVRYCWGCRLGHCYCR